MQAIYAFEISGSNLEDTIFLVANDLDVMPAKFVLDYSIKLSALTVKHFREMDSLIIERLKNWDLKRVSVIDHLILRMALSEMIYSHDVPMKVSISEGVEIAKTFSTDDSSGFVNGILDSVYNDLVNGKIRMKI